MIKGTPGDDDLIGTNTDNVFDLSQGGNDTAHAGGGDDVIRIGAAFTSADTLYGGAGNDRLVLNGDYSAGVTFAATTMTNIETIAVQAGYSYRLITADANIDPATLAAGTFTFDASGLGKHDTAHFNAKAETDAFIVFKGGAGDDVMTGSAFGNTFMLGKGGKDSATGGAGADSFMMGSHLTAADQLNGGNNTDPLSDSVDLNGDYAAQLVFGATTMRHISTIFVEAGHDYDLKIADATFDASMQTASIDASPLGAADHFTFDGSSETDTKLSIVGGNGTNTITGGALDDTIQLGAGKDTVQGGDGNDVILVEHDGDLTTGDTIDGGGGWNWLRLDGQTTVTLGTDIGDPSPTGPDITNIGLVYGYYGNYDITMKNSAVAAGQTLDADFSVTLASGSLHFNGSAEQDGSFIVFGSEGNDVLIGGAQHDRLDGDLGADTLTGGGGSDTFEFVGVAGSTGKMHDTVTDFAVGIDKFSFQTTVSAVDTAVTGGKLDDAHLNEDLHTVLQGHLHAHDAILFTADSGTAAGHTFLVVDANGQAGYQANADYVVDVTGGSNLAALSTSDFI